MLLGSTESGSLGAFVVADEEEEEQFQLVEDVKRHCEMQRKLTKKIKVGDTLRLMNDWMKKIRTRVIG